MKLDKLRRQTGQRVAQFTASRTANDVLPEDSDLFEEALGLRNKGDLAKALEVVTCLEDKYPEVAAIVGMTASIYWGLGDAENAAPRFAAVIALRPRSELASLGLFHTLWDLGETKQAIAELRRFLELADSEAIQELLDSVEDAGVEPRN